MSKTAADITSKSSKRSQRLRGIPVSLRLYKWAGRWGPFKVKIPCGECALTEDVIEDTLAKELANAKVDFAVKEWLTYWWEPLFAGGGWHAPIVLVDRQVISQGDALNRGILAEAVARLRLFRRRSPFRRAQAT